jgi:hypothetical protein
MCCKNDELMIEEKGIYSMKNFGSQEANVLAGICTKQ